MSSLLEVRDLRLSVPSTSGRVLAVDGVSFSIAKGETLALVGESGCGKSLTSLAILRLLAPAVQIEPGSRVALHGQDLATLAPEALRQVRGRKIAMIFQDPMTSLNPVLTIGDQIAEAIHAHEKVSKQAANDRVRTLLGDVGVGDADRRMRAYPHQLSGGLRQRAMIAMALAAGPELLIADEPTTALDVTVQAQILELLDRLRTEKGLAILLITHDLGVVAGRADRVAVMYAGQIVETASASALFAAPSHPYTRGLLAAMPSLTGPRHPLVPIPGMVPPPGTTDAGCRFRARCAQAFAQCSSTPPWQGEAPHAVRCWLTPTGAT